MNNFRVISDYQRLIIVQSVINIIASVFELIVNEVALFLHFFEKKNYKFSDSNGQPGLC